MTHAKLPATVKMINLFRATVHTIDTLALAVFKDLSNSMRRFEFFILGALIVSAGTVSGQTLKVKSLVLKDNETVPEFPGGRDSLFCYLESIWNQDLINKVDSGVIYVRFQVSRSGEVQSIGIDARNPFKSKAKKGHISVIDGKITNELIKAFERTPNWKPRMIGKKPKKSRIQTIPIGFPYKEQCN